VYALSLSPKISGDPILGNLVVFLGLDESYDNAGILVLEACSSKLRHRLFSKPQHFILSCVLRRYWFFPAKRLAESFIASEDHTCWNWLSSKGCLRTVSSTTRPQLITTPEIAIRRIAATGWRASEPQRKSVELELADQMSSILGSQRLEVGFLPTLSW